MVCARRYAVTTQERWASPPSSPTMVGSAVATIAESSAARNRTSMRLERTAKRRSRGTAGGTASIAGARASAGAASRASWRGGPLRRLESHADRFSGPDSKRRGDFRRDQQVKVAGPRAGPLCPSSSSAENVSRFTSQVEYRRLRDLVDLDIASGGARALDVASGRYLRNEHLRALHHGVDVFVDVERPGPDRISRGVQLLEDDAFDVHGLDAADVVSVDENLSRG